MRLFWGLIFCLFSSGMSSADWQTIAYDKKYDELEGEDFLLALQKDGKFAALKIILPKFKNQISDESYIYFNLWSTLAMNSKDSDDLINLTESKSSRIAFEKLKYWKSKGDFYRAFDQIRYLSKEVQTVDVLEIYLKLGLLSKSSEVFYQILNQGEEPTYNLLSSLQTVQRLNSNLYSQWLEALRVMRPEEDLANQLWVEFSPSVGSLTSAQSLRAYCRYNALYCYHAAEFLRQNGSRAEAWLWAHRVHSPKEHLKFKIHALIDSKNFIAIAASKKDIERLGLVKEERYAYALAYSLAIQDRCDELSKVNKGLSQQFSASYQEKMLKLSGKCFGSKI